MSPSIPIDSGLPVLGHLFPLTKDCLNHLRKLRERHGDIVQTPILWGYVVHLFGPDAAELVFSNRSGAFSNSGWKFFLRHAFPDSIMAMDGEEHRHHRRTMRGAFTASALMGYLVELNRSVARSLDSWPTEGSSKADFLIHPRINALSLDIAISAMMGAQSELDDVQMLARSFNDLTKSVISVPINLWPSRHWKGQRARRTLLAWLRAHLEEKRVGEGSDLFSRLIQDESQAGERLDEERLINHMIFVMMAAHDTTSPSISALIYLLAKHPLWQDRLRELSFQMESDNLSFDVLKDGTGALAEFEWVVNETLRLYPPVALMPRMTRKVVDFDGRTIPANTLISISPILTHRIPEYWPNPEEFDPLRFSNPQADRHSFAWIPFGGGAHHCIGRAFAMMEIKAVLHQMLRRFRWSVPEDYVLPVRTIPIAYPKDGLPVSIARL